MYVHKSAPPEINDERKSTRVKFGSSQEMRWCDKGGGAKKRAAGEVVVVVVVDMGKKSSFSTIKWSPILVLIVLTGVGVIDLILRPLTSWLLSSAWNGDDNRRAYDTTEVPIMVRENHTYIYIYTYMETRALVSPEGEADMIVKVEMCTRHARRYIS